MTKTLIHPVQVPDTLDMWRQQVTTHWDAYYRQTNSWSDANAYLRLMAIALIPVRPTNAKRLKSLLKLVKQTRYGEVLAQRLTTIYADDDYTRSLGTLVQRELHPHQLDKNERQALDWLLLETGALPGVVDSSINAVTFAQQVLDSLKDPWRATSAVRVGAGIIKAGKNVVLAGANANVVLQHYAGEKAYLRSYLSAIRTEWMIPTTSILPGDPGRSAIHLHQLYTPVDSWTEIGEKKSIEQLSERRFRSIEQDMHDARQPVLEVIATYPLVVVTGGPGTGKSSLCRFIATCLAFACDDKANEIDGLALLGSAWIHGAILPLYVSLRDFCADKDVFPSSLEAATAQCLLNYLRKVTDSFAPELERYLLNEDAPTQGTFLMLDGLDEVYEEEDRFILQRIIENWADRFPKSRVLVTSRTYAYRQDARWRLSDRFAAAELAPFTWKQIQAYIDNWYTEASLSRPSSFGGRSVASSRTHQMAQDLKKAIIDTKSLWPLARQPLMLSLLTLIHEDHKRLPDKRAELYEQTVQLLDRWNIPAPADQLHEKLAGLNFDRMRAALKLLAFDLQKQQAHYRSYPATIERQALLPYLVQQQENGDGLGAYIEDVLEYIATRNGILVSDNHDLYRFPHLSIQEYLAACALIELYDECDLPASVQRTTDEPMTFPENIVALMRQDPYRWRNTTLFAGSIIAMGKGQDRRWELIDELLTREKDAPISDNMLHTMYITAEIWSESFLKARNRTQKVIEEHLLASLKLIQNDERLDVPERAVVTQVLGRLEIGV